MPKITWDDLYTNFKSIYPNLGRQSLRFQPYDLRRPAETSEDVGLIFRTNSSSYFQVPMLYCSCDTTSYILTVRGRYFGKKCFSLFTHFPFGLEVVSQQ